MLPISSWYTTLGHYSFPTIFIELDNEEVQAIIADADEKSPEAKATMKKLRHAMKSLPGSSFIGTDLCMPTDSDMFKPRGRCTSGTKAWLTLKTSEKVKKVLREKKTSTLIVRPYRHMTTVREFRLFFKNRELKAMSQMNLERHFVRLALRADELWSDAQKFAEDIKKDLPEDDCVVDIYFTSSKRIMLIDMNSWGAPTDPLLLRTWDRNWEENSGLILIPPPVKMKGDISVSF